MSYEQSDAEERVLIPVTEKKKISNQESLEKKEKGGIPLPEPDCSSR